MALILCLVRAAVASRGYGLDELVNDEDDWVCTVVAMQGYGLDKLVNHENWNVRSAVYEYVEDHGYNSLADWMKMNPGKCVYTSEQHKAFEGTFVPEGISDEDFIAISEKDSMRDEYESADEWKKLVDSMRNIGDKVEEKPLDLRDDKFLSLG